VSRLVPLAGAYNFRDLGGYPTEDGRRTNDGVLFRSDTLQELTADDVAHIRDGLGVRRIVDLRSTAEVGQEGRGPLQDEPLAYVNVPLLPDLEEKDAVPAAIGADLSRFYLHVLEDRGDLVAEALALLCDVDHHPAVFHCAAGKDRTGLLAALALRIADVTAEAVVEDYAATNQQMDRVVARLRRLSYGRTMDDDPPEVYQAVGATMERFLEALDERHGGARAWAEAAGVPATALDRLSAALVDRP
jgi:protein tyrosine/serine phosphatase